MIGYLGTLLNVLGPRVRALILSLSVPVGLLVVAFMPPALAIIGAVVWVLLVAGGILAAYLEHRRDRRRGLRSWRTVPHPDPCPHCSDVCPFPPSRYGLEQAPDAHRWDADGRLVAGPPFDDAPELPAFLLEDGSDDHPDASETWLVRGVE